MFYIPFYHLLTLRAQRIRRARNRRRGPEQHTHLIQARADCNVRYKHLAVNEQIAKNYRCTSCFSHARLRPCTPPPCPHPMSAYS